MTSSTPAFRQQFTRYILQSLAQQQPVLEPTLRAIFDDFPATASVDPLFILQEGEYDHEAALLLTSCFQDVIQTLGFRCVENPGPTYQGEATDIVILDKDGRDLTQAQDVVNFIRTESTQLHQLEPCAAVFRLFHHFDEAHPGIQRALQRLPYFHPQHAAYSGTAILATREYHQSVLPDIKNACSTLLFQREAPNVVHVEFRKPRH